ncbi:MAG: PEP-CTERM sorting domain-containing protein [Phycisphaerae bacterium]|nr:PEP-CTERM sorting domain-containing protein [Phycisphaerae bacterium]
MRTFVALGVIATLVAAASAGTISYQDSVSFQGDLQPDQTITLSGYNGSDPLSDVLVEVWSDGAVSAAFDNDEPLQSSTVRLRMIRQYDVYLPAAGGSIGDAYSDFSAFLPVGADDGDGSATFDPTGADFVDFGTLSYTGESAGSLNPALVPYDGVPTVDFTVDVIQMVNDFQFTPNSLDAFQSEITDPDLTVYVKVTYTFIPEPASLGLLGLGLAFFRRR